MPFLLLLSSFPSSFLLSSFFPPSLSFFPSSIHLSFFFFFFFNEIWEQSSSAGPGFFPKLIYGSPGRYRSCELRMSVSATALPSLLQTSGPLPPLTRQCQFLWSSAYHYGNHTRIWFPSNSFPIPGTSSDSVTILILLETPRTSTPSSDAPHSSCTSPHSSYHTFQCPILQHFLLQNNNAIETPKANMFLL